jgi:hypothetical protein
MEFAALFIIAITIEALISLGKEIFTKGIAWQKLAAIGIAVFLVIAANKDLYAMVGVTFTIPYVGMVLTGIAASRGSNYLADLVKLFQSTASANRQIAESVEPCIIEGPMGPMGPQGLKGDPGNKEE